MRNKLKPWKLQLDLRTIMLLTHKVSFINKANSSSRPFFLQSRFKHSPSNPSGSYSQTFTPKPKSSGDNKDQNPLSQPICNYCKKTGHIISECLHLKRKKENKRGLNLQALPLYGQNRSHALKGGRSYPGQKV